MGRKHAPQGPNKAAPMGQVTYEPVRCTGHSARTGKPCKKFPIHGGTVCDTHGGRAPQVQQKARERLAALAPQAVQTLAALLIRDEFPTVQLGAARYVFDQAEGTATENVNVKQTGDMTYRWATPDDRP